MGEDISGKIPPTIRLGASFVSAILLVWIFSLQLTANGIPLLNSLFIIVTKTPSNGIK